MPNHRSIYLTATALTITQIVDGIKYVGFTHPIIADKAIHLRRKRQRGFRNIFIIEYGNALKYHQGQKYKIFSTATNPPNKFTLTKPRLFHLNKDENTALAKIVSRLIVWAMH